MTQQPAAAATHGFVRRAPTVPPATRWALALAGLGMLLIGGQLYALFPAEVWHRAGVKWLESWSQRGGLVQVGWLAGVLLPGLLWWIHRRGLRDGRLILANDRLQFSSGIPLLGSWVDWTLRLDDLPTDRLRLRLQTPALGSNALWIVRLAWGVSGLHLHHAPLAWARAFAPPQRTVFRLDLDHARLTSASDTRPTTFISVDLGAAYWRNQEDASMHPLDLRQGWAQRWTQYDTEALVRQYQARR